METLNDKKKGFRFPDTALLLMVIILLMGIFTHIMPAGQFERIIDEETGRELVVSGTYHHIEQSPVSVGQLFGSMFDGIVRASDIIAMVFVVGGALGIVSKTGAIAAGLAKLVKKLKGKEWVVVAIIMTAFAICGGTFSMAEEALPLVVILTVVALKLGYDQIVGVSMVVIALYCGYTAGPINPYNTGIAQGIAELPLFSGMGLRLVLMAGALIIAIVFTVRHGEKYRKEKHDNSALIAQYGEIEEREITKLDKFILIVLALTIITLVIGVVRFEWMFREICALFMAMGLLTGGIYHKGNMSQVAKDFIEGAGEMTTACLYIGLSRAVLVIMEDGMIMDTLVYWLSIPLSHLSSTFAAWGMYFSQGIINFFIPSSTGQAVVVMPILSPLSDLVGISRQTAVLAYQCGDGFWNMITPTHSVLMASLGLAKVPFEKWFKFGIKIVIAWTVWVMVVLSIATTAGYGPF